MQTYNDDPARVAPPESPVELTDIQRANQDKNDADQLWRNQDILSEAVGDGLAYRIATDDIFHANLVKAKEAGDVNTFGTMCLEVISDQVMQWV